MLHKTLSRRAVLSVVEVDLVTLIMRNSNLRGCADVADTDVRIVLTLIERYPRSRISSRRPCSFSIGRLKNIGLDIEAEAVCVRDLMDQLVRTYS